MRALLGGGEGRGDGEEGGDRGRRSRATVVLPGGAGKTVLRSLSMAFPRALSSASSRASSSAVPVGGRERVCGESMLGDGSPMAGSKVKRRRLAEGMHARGALSSVTVSVWPLPAASMTAVKPLTAAAFTSRPGAASSAVTVSV